MEFIPIAQVEAAVQAQTLRDHWVPMFDGTGLCIAFAFKNDEELAWMAYGLEPGNYLVH